MQKKKNPHGRLKSCLVLIKLLSSYRCSFHVNDASLTCSHNFPPVSPRDQIMSNKLFRTPKSTTTLISSQHGNTALHEAAWKGFSRTVDLLCKNKSNYYLRNRGGFSPLHLCCQNGHNESCRVLLRAGCKPNIKNNVSVKHL